MNDWIIGEMLVKQDNLAIVKHTGDAIALNVTTGRMLVASGNALTVGAPGSMGIRLAKDTLAFAASIEDAETKRAALQAKLDLAR